MDITKLDRTARVLALVGLIAFIDTFLEWATVSINGHTFSGYGGNAWDTGFAAWFAMILLLAVGVVAFLPAIGTTVNVPGGLSLVGAAAGVLSLILILLRWVTFPSYTDPFGGGSAGLTASYGMYVGIVLSVVAAVFGWLGYTAEGGSFNTLGSAFKSKSVPPAPPQG